MIRLVLITFLLATQLAPGYAEQATVQFCWSLGKHDNTVYYAEVEGGEDRQKSFEELIEISGIDHHPVQCRNLNKASDGHLRAQMFKDWLETELDTVNTSFLSDLDY